VVGVLLVSILNGADEVDKLELIQIEVLNDLVLRKKVPGQDLQGKTIRLALQLKDIEFPLIGLIQTRPKPVQLGGGSLRPVCRIGRGRALFGAR